MASRVRVPGPTISDTIRATLAEQMAGGRSMYDVAKRGGLDHATVSRFAAGKNGLTGPSVDRLAWALGLALAPIGAPPPAPAPDPVPAE